MLCEEMKALMSTGSVHIENLTASVTTMVSSAAMENGPVVPIRLVMR